jgi:ADP-ribose pyrophosphatase
MNKWHKIGEKTVYEGNYRKMVQKTYKLPNGNEVDYDIFEDGEAATVLALTDDNKIVCFKQFRPGPEKILYELPGGNIEDDEDPLESAQRELLEETGYDADLTHFGSFYQAPYMNGKLHMFIGRNAKRVNNQMLDENEFGEVVLLDINEFKERLLDSEIADIALGLAGLDSLGLL